MDIALMNEKVTFQKNVVNVDAVGNHISSWEDFYSCMATISGEAGKEAEDAGTVVYHPDMDVTIRWCKKASQIDVLGFRVYFHGNLYDIMSINHMNYKKKSIKFTCRREERSG